ncbi:hypothetical protein [Actinomadura alba]|uniref:Uncharacterized protein n=1 Tax=Actinomadura alba TaxID=406431 RepID=A0ABR7LLP9_9ACTN|nr:hypothetical protein [Actinomadura alba]MBC6465757.1 hypothetical protein [Actinomadura alba]
MADPVSRRRLLGGAGGVAAGGLLTAAGPSGSAVARAGTRDPRCAGAPPAVAPVNREVAARHGLDYKAMPRQAVGVDVDSLITLDSTADVAARRARLIEYVWKGAGLPARLPGVARGVSTPELASLTGVRRIDELSVPLAHGVTSRVFHVLPQRGWNHRLAVYHNGHGEAFDTMVGTLRGLLHHGYSVLVCAMPFMHWNARAIADPAGAGRPVKVTSHDELARWESARFSGLTFFLEPVAVALNHAIATYRPTSVQMIGLSGGGWTTTVYAAIDPRVTRSYPAAGSLPFYLRSAAPYTRSTIGDWEQRKDTLPGFYGIAGYLDMYVMAATGPRRRQMQVLNRFDPCCFGGVGHRSYSAAVSHRAGVIGGDWDVLDDATHDRHSISPYALSAILRDLDAGHDG